MKRLTDRDNDFHILQGLPATIQKKLNMMSDRYDIKIHAVNVSDNGTTVVVVERMKTEKQMMLEDLNA